MIDVPCSNFIQMFCYFNITWLIQTKHCSMLWEDFTQSASGLVVCKNLQ